MKYEVGKVLKINNTEWGLLDYKKGKVTLYSFNNKQKRYAEIPKNRFDVIYKNASNDISTEVLEFAKEEKRKAKEFKKRLKPGVKFVGGDKGEYTLLSISGKKATFYQDGDNDEYICDISFIKSLTGEFNEDYINHLTPVTTITAYKALSDKEKVMIGINQCKGGFAFADDLEILELGNIINGEAFYHEVDEYYGLKGLQIKFRYTYHNRENTQVGFFPIYIGKVANYYPTSFKDSFGNLDFNEHKYENGLGDYIVVDEILVDKSIVNKAVQF